MHFDRRDFLQGLLALPLSSLSAGKVLAQSGAGPTDRQTLAPWTPGCLDIHHLATGRGNATFILMPDGTSLLIDAGATADTLDVSSAPKPSSARRPGEWVGRYVQRHLRAIGLTGLDYLLVTHLHPDHLGDVTDASPASRQGDYCLTGVMDVAEIVPVGTLMDRAFPHYDFPVPLSGRFAENYMAFVRARVQQGLRVERFHAGSARQIGLLGHVAVPQMSQQGGPGSAPVACSVRNLAANGEVWTGAAEQTRAMFPPLAQLAPQDYPNENLCSTALRLSYGKFGYFTAGDLTSYTFDGALPWRNVLTAAAQVCGPVDVATADHHGMFDGLSPETVRLLRPQAWVIPSWHISHPDLLQLERMFSERLYAGPRDVFATSLMHENYLANRRLVSRMRSRDGHVVVRVAPGGGSFHVQTTDNTDETDHIKLSLGPYVSGLNAASAPA
jgi:hypothetical protein